MNDPFDYPEEEAQKFSFYDAMKTLLLLVIVGIGVLWFGGVL